MLRIGIEADKAEPDLAPFLDEARVQFEAIANRNPSDIGARTMVGMLLDAQGKLNDAIKAYEATVNGPGNAPVAANNLAFIYAEQGTNLDRALQRRAFAVAASRAGGADRTQQARSSSDAASGDHAARRRAVAGASLGAQSAASERGHAAPDRAWPSLGEGAGAARRSKARRSLAASPQAQGQPQTKQLQLVCQQRGGDEGGHRQAGGETT